MDYEFEIYVWTATGGILDRYYYKKAWEGDDYDDAITKLKEIAAQNKGKCVKLEWRPNGNQNKAAIR